MSITASAVDDANVQHLIIGLTVEAIRARGRAYVATHCVRCESDDPKQIRSKCVAKRRHKHAISQTRKYMTRLSTPF
jgi:hypothetical protein